MKYLIFSLLLGGIFCVSHRLMHRELLFHNIELNKKQHYNSHDGLLVSSSYRKIIWLWTRSSDIYLFFFVTNHNFQERYSMFHRIFSENSNVKPQLVTEKRRILELSKVIGITQWWKQISWNCIRFLFIQWWWLYVK